MSHSGKHRGRLTRVTPYKPKSNGQTTLGPDELLRPKVAFSINGDQQLTKWMAWCVGRLPLQSREAMKQLFLSQPMRSLAGHGVLWH